MIKLEIQPYIDSIELSGTGHDSNRHVVTESQTLLLRLSPLKRYAVGELMVNGVYPRGHSSIAPQTFQELVAMTTQKVLTIIYAGDGTRRWAPEWIFSFILSRSSTTKHVS